MKLLSTIILILAIILFPPATLALVSNDAVPGDATYPIKRGLEDVIYSVASLNSATKAWFAAARSDRRFKEFSILIAQGKTASGILNELVTQTETAASEIKKIDDPIRRQDLLNQLSESINKYDQKLGEVSQNLPTVVSPTPVATPVPSASTPARVSPSPTITTPRPQATIGPTTTTPTVRPTLIPKPSEAPKPTLTPIPTQAPTPHPSINPQEIDEAKKKLEEIKKKLEEEKKSHQEKSEDRQNEDRVSKTNSERSAKEKKDQSH